MGTQFRTGQDLKEARLAQRLSQRELARRCKLSHKAVQYWEAQVALDPYGYAPQRLAVALGRRIFRPIRARPSWGLSPEVRNRNEKKHQRPALRHE